MRPRIEQQTNILSKRPESFEAEFSFPETFVGFDGHFPDQSVLPGVCLVQAVLVAAEKALDQKLELAEIVLAKFFSISQPDEKLTAVCRVDEDMVRAKISRGEDRVAEIRLKVSYA